MIKQYLFYYGKIEADFASKRVVSIVFDGEELIEGNVSFFRIRMRKKDATYRFIDAKDFSFEGFVDDKAFYHHKDVDVYLSISQFQNGIEWGIDVKNHTKELIEQVEIMSIGLHPELEEDGGKGEIVVPYNEGERITSMRRREASAFRYFDVDYPSMGVYHMYPNMISSQFMGYIANGKGIYLGMHDKSFTPKHIDFRVVDSALKTELSVFSNCDYGEDYKMDFPSLMLFFKGNFYDACDIYRNWFYENIAPSMRTIKDKYNELPKWYHESPIIVTYPVVGKKDSDLEMKPGGLYPYTNALPIIERFAKETDSKIMALLMQWESTAPWAPPYVWPPYGDINDFYLFRDKLHEEGNYLGLYTSGFGWTNKSYRRDYDKTKEFEEKGYENIICTNSDGSAKSYTVCDIRLGYDVCPALDESKRLFVDEAKKMIDAEVDYVQILDQNHGGNPYFCYSDKHGHIPAPGKWQIEETKKLLKMIDKKQCLLGCESAASEPYIEDLMFSDNRYILNHNSGDAIPMYAYIYHEYVNNFMGNQICYCLSSEPYSLPFRIAYSFICGDMFTLVIDGDGKTHIAWCDDTIIDETSSLKLLKNLNAWRRNFEGFLHLGKMIKPHEYKCGVKHFKFKWGDYEFSFPSVLSSSFSDEKTTLQFFVNYDDKEEEIEIDGGFEGILINLDGKEEKIKSNKIVIPPLAAIALR